MTLFTTVRGLQFWLTEKDFKEGKVAHYIRQNYHLLIAFPAAGLLQRLHIRHLQHVLQQLYSGKVRPHSYRYSRINHKFQIQFLVAKASKVHQDFLLDFHNIELFGIQFLASDYPITFASCDWLALFNINPHKSI